MMDDSSIINCVDTNYTRHIILNVIYSVILIHMQRKLLKITDINEVKSTDTTIHTNYL